MPDKSNIEDATKATSDDYTNEDGVNFIDGDIKPTAPPEFIEMTHEDEAIIRGAA